MRTKNPERAERQYYRDGHHRETDRRHDRGNQNGERRASPSGSPSPNLFPSRRRYPPSHSVRTLRAPPFQRPFQRPGLDPRLVRKGNAFRSFWPRCQIQTPAIRRRSVMRRRLISTATALLSFRLISRPSGRCLYPARQRLDPRRRGNAGFGHRDRQGAIHPAEGIRAALPSHMDLAVASAGCSRRNCRTAPSGACWKTGTLRRSIHGPSSRPARWQLRKHAPSPSSRDQSLPRKVARPKLTY